jgi:anti-anti-sigma factor
MAELDDALADIEIVSPVPGCVEIRLRGEIDVPSAEELAETIREVIDSAPKRVDFDLEGVTFMDSSGIALLLTAANAVEDVRIVKLSAPARRIIELTGLDSFLHLQ